MCGYASVGEGGKGGRGGRGCYVSFMTKSLI